MEVHVIIAHGKITCPISINIVLGGHQRRPGSCFLERADMNPPVIGSWIVTRVGGKIDRCFERTVDLIRMREIALTTSVVCRVHLNELLFAEGNDCPGLQIIPDVIIGKF